MYSPDLKSNDFEHLNKITNMINSFKANMLKYGFCKKLLR